MTFTADLSKWCKETAPGSLDTVVRKTVIEIGARAVMMSPVGDPSSWKMPAPAGYVGGRFRGNWQHGVGSAPTGEIERIDAGGGTTISDITSSVMLSKAAKVHWIANNLPYSERIENGWSRQAPSGIVNLIELEFPAIVNRAKQ